MNNQHIIKVASVFSGIGAFEAALSQMDVKHDIVFACDNGEIDIRLTYRQISNLSKHLSQEEKIEFVNKLLYRYQEVNKAKESKLNFDIIYNNLYVKTRSTAKLEMSYDCIILLTKDYTSKQREEFVDELYRLAGKKNYVKESYLANYKLDATDWHNDIRFLDATKYETDIDVLVGGSPCQSFSTYGKKMGLEDARGTLFYDYARLIKTLQPKVFIYENVKNLLKHDNGRTWDVMTKVWESLNYVLSEPTILDAQNYGTPQKRERLFLVGFRKDIIGDAKYVFPPKQQLTRFAPEYLDNNIPEKYYLGKKGFEWVTNNKKNKNKTRYNRDIIGCQTANQQDNWIGDLRIEPVQEWQRNDARIYIGTLEGKECVARKMTPSECLRLMGFNNFVQVVDDHQLYRQSGNSIVVTVLEALLRSILPYITK